MHYLYECLYCDQSYRKMSAWKAHVLTRHLEPDADEGQSSEQQPEQSEKAEGQADTKSTGTDGEDLTPLPPDNPAGIYWPCKFCGEVFLGKGRLSAHLTEVHELNMCLECLRAFPSAVALQDHMFSSHWKRKFRCDVCDKSFQNRHGLNRHVQGVHEKKRDHVCQHCNRAFFEKCRLRAHILDKHKINEIEI